jgi:hypothetical protein
MFDEQLDLSRASSSGNFRIDMLRSWSHVCNTHIATNLANVGRVSYEQEYNLK